MSHDELHSRAVEYFRGLQDRICAALEAADGPGRFREDAWDRPGGGGGRSRVLEDGGVFEKAGVNFSEVFGEFSPEFAKQVPGDGLAFTAAGVSLVLHPRSPRVPTVHANFRFLTRGSKAWFGGGADLTPYYPVREDVVHFHRTWQAACDRHRPLIDYPKYKEWCDRYFFLPHRNEPRGIGGLFFDDWTLGGFAKAFAMARSVGDHFIPAYLPIVQARRDTAYGERERQFQLYRRGRYVEFNLVHDRGTLFGLQSGGRAESILMSMPPQASWRYDWRPEPGTPEAELYEKFLVPRDWV